MTDFFNTFLNIDYMLEVLPAMLAYGVWNTLLLSLTSTFFGILIGLFIAVLGVSRSKFLRFLASVYTDTLRGLPAILTILIIGTGFSQALRPITGGNPHYLAIFALSLIAGAYIGEIFRGGIQAVDKGQMEASRALGMSYGSAMTKVIVPQAARQVLPSLVNQFIGLVKDSSLVYILGLVTTQREIFRIGQDGAIQTGNLSPLVLAGFFYLIVTVPLTHLVNFIDRRLRNGKPKKRVIDPEQNLQTNVISVREAEEQK